MISYQKISRWLSFPVDPITVEDWVANREIFGPTKDPDQKEREIEWGYNLEKAMEKMGEGIFLERDDFLVVLPKMMAETWVYGEKIEKIDLPQNGVLTVVSNPRLPVRVKVGKREWSGIGKNKIIFAVF